MPEPRPLSQVLAEADVRVREGRSYGAAVWPTGFTPLDGYLGGGLRSGELALLGGAQGLGKTTFALQAARNLASSGYRVLYLCFEHSELQLLERLIALEAGLALGVGALTLSRVRSAALRVDPPCDNLAYRLGEAGGGAQAVRAVASYAHRLQLVCTSGARAGVTELTDWVGSAPAEQRPAVFVDYLQKLRVPVAGLTEEEQVTVVVESLKDLALEHDVPVFAIVAADKEGMGVGRTRLRHLRGSSSLAYESDVALLLNEKFDIVARHHLVYDLTAAERFKALAVCSIEKNRSGLDGIDLEFRKHFDQGRFEANGDVVTEQLLDERVFVD